MREIRTSGICGGYEVIHIPTDRLYGEGQKRWAPPGRGRGLDRLV